MPVTGGFGFNPAVAAKKGPNAFKRAPLGTVAVNGGRAAASKPEATNKVRDKGNYDSCCEDSCSTE